MTDALQEYDTVKGLVMEYPMPKTIVDQKGVFPAEMGLVAENAGVRKEQEFEVSDTIPLVDTAIKYLLTRNAAWENTFNYPRVFVVSPMVFDPMNEEYIKPPQDLIGPRIENVERFIYVTKKFDESAQAYFCIHVVDLNYELFTAPLKQISGTMKVIYTGEHGKFDGAEEVLEAKENMRRVFRAPWDIAIDVTLDIDPAERVDFYRQGKDPAAVAIATIDYFMRTKFPKTNEAETYALDKDIPIVYLKQIGAFSIELIQPFSMEQVEMIPRTGFLDMETLVMAYDILKKGQAPPRLQGLFLGSPFRYQANNVFFQ